MPTPHSRFQINVMRATQFTGIFILDISQRLKVKMHARERAFTDESKEPTIAKEK